MKKFIILSTQRSGSTFLVNSLASHPQIKAYGEIFQKFGPKFVNNPNPPLHYKIGYRQYRKASPLRRVSSKLWRRKSIYRYLDEIYAMPADKAAVGFKFMYSQGAMYPEILDWLTDNNISVIHLFRENILKTIVSLGLAKKRGIFASTKPLERVQVFLEPESLRAQLEKRTKLIEKYRLRYKGNPYMEMSYEDFVKSKDSETKRFLNFLGIEDSQVLTSDLAKVNSDNLKDLIENYEAVVNVLRGTAFEVFLD